MPNPLVIAYHLVWTIYGVWLPNDPRGSGSAEVRRDDLAALGDTHLGRKHVQPAGHTIRKFYNEATPLLQHSVVRLDERARESAACGLAESIAQHRYTVYACAVMPDHVHLVVRKHRHSAEEMLRNLKALSRKRLVADGFVDERHPAWTAGDGWKAFLDHPDAVRRTITYVENNPVKDGLLPQRWDFVTAYDGWPLHPGHSPNSPYAKALRAVGRYPR